ncbi:Hypothetical predicted protein, partial [Cloeon dipterum]
MQASTSGGKGDIDKNGQDEDEE